MTATPWALRHDVGIGDFINAESFWPADRKAALRTVHHASPDDSLVAAMRACPDFRHVEHKGLRYPTEVPPGSVGTMRDHAISHRLTFRGSSFLKGPLDCEVPADLPDRFAYIQESTPKNGPACDRFLRPEEWGSVLARLEEWDAVGLVVNLDGGAFVPPDPRLVDYRGRTAMPGSIEALKRAVGYIGIDSCFAILAAQLFPADRLMVRTVNPHLYLTPRRTYPPQAGSSFLYPRLDAEPWPDPAPDPAPGVLVELRCVALVDGRSHHGGARVEVAADRAARMIAAGQAFAIEAPTATPESPP